MSDSVDWGNVESQLKQKAGQWYDPSMLGDVQRNVSYGSGNSVDQNSLNDWVNRVSNKAQLRGSNDANSTYQDNGQGGTTTNQQGQINTPQNPNPTVAGGGLPPPSQGLSGSPGFTGSYQSFSGFGGGPNSNQWNQNASNLFQTLMGRASQSLNVNPDDPIIKNQVNAYNANATRQMRNDIDAQAEAGGPNANLDLQRRMASENVAQGTGTLQSTLMGNELTARRTEIQNALTGMQGMLTNEQSLALQRELGLIDANLRQQGINSGNDQFAQTFGLNALNQANFWDNYRRNGGA